MKGIVTLGLSIVAGGCSHNSLTTDEELPPPPDARTAPTDTAAPETKPAPPTPTCTQVIGYSQVGQPRGGWFVSGGAFESVVDDARWQLLWNSGAGVDRWQNSDYRGWTKPVESPCTEGPVDRVLLSVSGPYGDDVDAWSDAIEATLTTIRTLLPEVKTIVLQPVVGGPDHQPCPSGGTDVRASWQHAYIDEAIDRVVGGDVHAGASPEVRSCDDYTDAVGHLTEDAAEAIGRTIGEVYAAASDGP